MRKILTSLLAAAMLSAGSARPVAAGQTARVLRTSEYRALQRKLCRGWNTWSANSVLAHVYLPDGFALTLGLKSAGMGHGYQNTFFQANAMARRPEKIRLGPHADDGSYTELTLEWNSGGADSKNVALVQSAAENGDEYILVNVQKRAPLRAEHLIVETGYYWNRPGTTRS
jgi:putative isomerase